MVRKVGLEPTEFAFWKQHVCHSITTAKVVGSKGLEPLPIAGQVPKTCVYIQFHQLPKLVRGRGVEPLCPSAYAPQAYVSANSTNPAKWSIWWGSNPWPLHYQWSATTTVLQMQNWGKEWGSNPLNRLMKPPHQPWLLSFQKWCAEGDSNPRWSLWLVRLRVWAIRPTIGTRAEIVSMVASFLSKADTCYCLRRSFVFGLKPTHFSVKAATSSS